MAGANGMRWHELMIILSTAKRKSIRGTFHQSIGDVLLLPCPFDSTLNRHALLQKDRSVYWSSLYLNVCSAAFSALKMPCSSPARLHSFLVATKGN